jgi:hypothetical protein
MRYRLGYNRVTTKTKAHRPTPSTREGCHYYLQPGDANIYC